MNEYYTTLAHAVVTCMLLAVLVSVGTLVCPCAQIWLGDASNMLMRYKSWPGTVFFAMLLVVHMSAINSIERIMRTEKCIGTLNSRDMQARYGHCVLTPKCMAASCLSGMTACSTTNPLNPS